MEITPTFTSATVGFFSTLNEVRGGCLEALHVEQMKLFYSQPLNFGEDFE